MRKLMSIQAQVLLHNSLFKMAESDSSSPFSKAETDLISSGLAYILY